MIKAMYEEKDYNTSDSNSKDLSESDEEEEE